MVESIIRTRSCPAPLSFSAASITSVGEEAVVTDAMEPIWKSVE
jgi:hypothetical protein